MNISYIDNNNTELSMLVSDDDTYYDVKYIHPKNKQSFNKKDRSNSRMYKNSEPSEKVFLELIKIPISHKLEFTDHDKSIMSFDINPKYSTNIEYPKFELGFHHYIHQSKNNSVIFNDFKGKKRVYHVVNQYEKSIDNYDKSIGNVTNTYFDITGNKPKILSRAFFKLWEIINYYNLISTTQTSFTSAHLAEGPGSFIQATMFFRDKFSKKSTDDSYHAITIHSEKEHGDDEDVRTFEKEFIDYYSKEKPQRLKMHKTYTKQVAGGSKSKDNGDLIDPKTIKLFKNDFKNKVDFITADGGFDWSNENIQEQEAFKLIFGQIITALNIQKKGGNFVCKFFETFTMSSVKLLSILAYFYEEININKPLTSRSSNSEKYVICTGFKYDESDIKSELSIMLDALDNMKNNKDFIVDIFPNYNISPELKTSIIAINTNISNIQFKFINKMMEFIVGSNYYGDAYHNYRNIQIEGTKHWIDTFIDKSISSIQKKSQELLIESNNNSLEVKNRFSDNLVFTSNDKPNAKFNNKDDTKKKVLAKPKAKQSRNNK